MSFPSYPSYRESGLEWIPSLPSHWSSAGLRWLAKRYAGGTPDKNREDFWENGTIPWLNSGSVNQGLIQEPSAFITDKAFASSSTRWVPAGALLMALAGQGKTKGMTAQLAFRATCNQSTAAIVPGNELASRYLLWWLSANYQNIRNMSGGDHRDGLNLELLGDILCPLPPIREQTTIAAFLDRETAKIDALVEEQRRLIELLKEEIIALVLSAYLERQASELRLGDAVDVIDRPVTQVPGETYRPLGIYNRGRGLFHKEPKDTEDMGDSDFSWIEPGDLIISGQFAWEGAVALAGDAEAGCVVSHRYPVLRGRTDVALTEYVFGLFLTTHGQFLLNEHSRGAAGRNRPLNLNTLLKEKILVPDLPHQALIRDRILALGTIRGEVAAQAELLQERRAALISAAVTGKIDVRDTLPQQAEAA